MICGRFAFLIIYFTLFGLNPGYSWAAKSNLANANIISEKTLLNKNAVVSLEKNYSELKLKSQKTVNFQSAPPKIAHPRWKSKLREKAIAQNRSLNPEPPDEFNRLWSLRAMALISAIALFLIWILFSKPKQKETLKTKSFAGEDDLLHDLAATKSDPNIAFDDSFDDSVEVKKSTVKDEVAQTSIPFANVDAVQRFINDLQHLDSCNEPTSVQIALKRQAIWKLAQVEGYCSIEPLLKVMPQVKGLDKNLILEAVRQINQRSYQSINHELFAALHHENPQARLQALRDLKDLYQFVSPAITKIAQMQSDRDYEVRQTAIQILLQLNASPLPTFYDPSEEEVDNLMVGQESKENLHLVAYLLAELDAKQ